MNSCENLILFLLRLGLDVKLLHVVGNLGFRVFDFVSFELNLSSDWFYFLLNCSVGSLILILHFKMVFLSIFYSRLVSKNG